MCGYCVIFDRQVFWCWRNSGKCVLLLFSWYVSHVFCFIGWNLVSLCLCDSIDLWCLLLAFRVSYTPLTLCAERYSLLSRTLTTCNRMCPLNHDNRISEFHYICRWYGSYLTDLFPCVSLFTQLVSTWVFYSLHRSASDTTTHYAGSCVLPC